MLKSTNRIVNAAIEAQGGKDRESVAANGRVEDKVRVTMERFNFDGLRKDTKVMTLAGLKQLLAQTKSGAAYRDVLYHLEKSGATDIKADQTITIEVEWASRA